MQHWEGSSSSREELLEFGFDDYLAKPLMLQNLEEALQRLAPPSP